MEDIIPHYTPQQQSMVHNLMDNARVQGMSSNVKGDNACITCDSTAFLEQYPKEEEKETMEHYYLRVFGPADDTKWTDEQKEARQTLKQMQIKKEMSTLHAYHFDEFTPSASSSSALSLSFFGSSTEKREGCPRVPNTPRHKKRRE